MLSKQVKNRIASNRHFHTIPVWRRKMYQYFRSQIAMVQRQYDTAKHIDGDDGLVRRTQLLSRRNELTLQFETWTRKDWRKHEEQERKLLEDLRVRMQKRKEILQSLSQDQISAGYNQQFGGSVVPPDFIGHPDHEQLMKLIDASPNVEWTEAFKPKKSGE